MTQNIYTFKATLKRFTIKKLLQRLFLYSIWYPLLHLLDWIIPKNPQLWVFCPGLNYPFHSNQRILYDYACQQNEHQIVVLLIPGSIPLPDIPHEHCILANSLQGLWSMLRAQVIIVHRSSDEMYFRRGISAKRHTVFNVWHGIPIKGIGHHESSNKAPILRHLQMLLNIQQFTTTICSSTLDRTVMSSGFRIPFEKLLISGLPRNDWLLDNPEVQTPYFLQEIRKIKNYLNHRGLILYAPTFRNHGSGIYPFSTEEIQILEQFLQPRGLVLGIRTHLKHARDFAASSESILFLDNAEFPETQALLKNTQVLITDYSGIWIDFLLTGLPIIGFPYDQAAYQADCRPFMYDLTSIYPGTYTNDFAGLIEKLTQLLDHGMSEAERLRYQTILQLFHSFPSGGATQRVYHHLHSISSKTPHES